MYYSTISAFFLAACHVATANIAVAPRNLASDNLRNLERAAGGDAGPDIIPDWTVKRRSPEPTPQPIIPDWTVKKRVPEPTPDPEPIIPDWTVKKRVPEPTPEPIIPDWTVKKRVPEPTLFF